MGRWGMVGWRYTLYDLEGSVLIGRHVYGLDFPEPWSYEPLILPRLIV